MTITAMRPQKRKHTYGGEKLKNNDVNMKRVPTNEQTADADAATRDKLDDDPTRL